MKTILSLILAGIVLAGCGAEYHLKKAIAKGAIIEHDTVYQEKTVIVPGDSTVVQLPGSRVLVLDTIYLTKENIKIRIRRDTIREEIHVECPPDTVRVEVPIAVNTTISCPKTWKWVALTLAAAFVVLLILFNRNPR